MKKLSFSQPLLLITIGLPGAGKSHFARQLAESYGVSWVHGNRLRQALYPKPTFRSEEEAAVHDLAAYVINEVLRTKGHLIVDINANQKTTRQQLHKLAQEAGYQVLLVWLQTDSETAAQRAARHGSRPQDDQFATPLNNELFTEAARRLHRPSHGEMYVVISGKHAFSTQVRSLQAKLRSLEQPSSSQADGSKPEATSKNNLPSVPQIHREQPIKGRSTPHPGERQLPKSTKDDTERSPKKLIRRLKIR